MAHYSNVSTPRFNNVAEAAQMLYRDSAQAQDVVTEMICAGYSINAQDMDGNTALHWAAWFRLDTLVQRLLEGGAKQDIGNNAGETAIHWAAKSSNVYALNLTTEQDRGFLSVRDVDGFTPFLIASQNDNAPIMEWMYLKGISVEEQDDFGRTALHWASYKGHRRTVQWLLSRNANVAHRDHEGMTAIHWASLKGHEPIAEMLIDVGSIYLLDSPDTSGDTPISLAVRKKHRYMVLSYHKSKCLFSLIGRPYLSHNQFANLYCLFMIYNGVIFILILAPNLWKYNKVLVLFWGFLLITVMSIWFKACMSDPGWMTKKTIVKQHSRISESHEEQGFDALQPVESQMVRDLSEDPLDNEGTELARLEVEQTKFNYQRQLILEARRRLNETDASCCVAPVVATGAGAELQPLMTSIEGQVDPQIPPSAQQAQLQRASFHLFEKAKTTGERLGKERVALLMDQGCNQYYEAVDKGDFKQVCVVCRTKREMRSHHCKECGRCVHRLDHHCPWIDNCVGVGNQRTFYLFIVCLLILILQWYYVVWEYAVNVLIPAIFGDEVELWQAVDWRFAPEFSQLVIFVTLAFNLIWLLFVGALVVRHTTYMMVNVTTYEVLVRPPHVQKRFPKAGSKFWFLADCNVVKSIRNCLHYWTLNDSTDKADFMMETDDSKIPLAPSTGKLPDNPPSTHTPPPVNSSIGLMNRGFPSPAGPTSSQH